MYKRCLENEPNNLGSLDSLPLVRSDKADCLCSQAIAYFKLNNNFQALQSLKLSLGIDPKHSLALETLLKIHFMNGDNFKVVLLSSEMLFSTSGVIADTYNYLALSNARNGNIIATIEALEKCSEIDPKYP